VTVSDDDAMLALLEILHSERLLTEPATSCSVAALTQGKIGIGHGENVVVVLCGANIALVDIRNWAERNRPCG
jgi:threonine dehydratase